MMQSRGVGVGGWGWGWGGGKGGGGRHPPCRLGLFDTSSQFRLGSDGPMLPQLGSEPAVKRGAAVCALFTAKQFPANPPYVCPVQRK